MKKLLPIFLIIALLAGCSGKTAPTAAPSVQPTESPSAVPTSAPDEPSQEPTSEPVQPSVPSIKEQIRLKWEENDPDGHQLDYVMRTLPYDLVYAWTVTDREHPENDNGGGEYLFRLTGDDRVYETVACAPYPIWTDGVPDYEDTFWRGAEGAGVDRETAEAICAFVTAHPQYLPVDGVSSAGETYVIAAVEERVLVYTQARTQTAYDMGDDYADLTAIVAVPMAAAQPTYSGGYSTLMYDMGFGWSAAEG